MNYQWANPLLLLLFIPLFIWVWFEWRINRFRETSVTISTLLPISFALKSSSQAGRVTFLILRAIALSILILALARPQSVAGGERSDSEGVDIILVLDVSGSMLSLDFKPRDRLEASKEAAKKFVDSRPNDRIGLVVFSKEAYTQCPLTTDHAVLRKMIDLCKVRELEEDGTAIGAGLTTALARLERSKAPSKVVILLTDGVNNQMVFSPLDAAERAKSMGVRVYTVGVGKEGMAPYPVPTPYGIQLMDVPVEIDEGLLQKIAAMTGATYNRATDNQALNSIYAKIDQLERYKIEGVKWRRVDDKFHWFIAIALLFLFSETVLRLTYFRSVL